MLMSAVLVSWRNESDSWIKNARISQLFFLNEQGKIFRDLIFIEKKFGKRI